MDEDVVFDEESGDRKALDKLAKLKETLKLCEVEKSEYLDGWQRAKADLVNARKEIEGDRVKMASFANQSLVEELLLVLDSFDMAMTGEAWSTVDENWRKGVENIQGQLMSTLAGHGLLEIESNGKEFNPELHDSAEELETDDAKQDQHIESTLQRGYKLKDKVLRPAKVRVYSYKGAK